MMAIGKMGKAVLPNACMKVRARIFRFAEINGWIAEKNVKSKPMKLSRRGAAPQLACVKGLNQPRFAETAGLMPGKNAMTICRFWTAWQKKRFALTRARNILASGLARFGRPPRLGKGAAIVKLKLAKIVMMEIFSRGTAVMEHAAMKDHHPVRFRPVAMAESRKSGRIAMTATRPTMMVVHQYAQMKALRRLFAAMARWTMAKIVMIKMLQMATVVPTYAKMKAARRSRLIAMI